MSEYTGMVFTLNTKDNKIHIIITYIIDSIIKKVVCANSKTSGPCLSKIVISTIILVIFIMNIRREPIKNINILFIIGIPFVIIANMVSK